MPKQGKHWSIDQEGLTLFGRKLSPVEPKKKDILNQLETEIIDMLDVLVRAEVHVQSDPSNRIAFVQIAVTTALLLFAAGRIREEHLQDAAEEPNFIALSGVTLGGKEFPVVIFADRTENCVKRFAPLTPKRHSRKSRAQ